jgi:hypothetical protein
MFVGLVFLVLMLLFFLHGVVLFTWCSCSFHIGVGCKQGKVDHDPLFFAKNNYMKKF